MVFQGEDVPLSEDILKKKVEFVKTWIEWSAENREQILFSDTVSNGTVTLHAVAAGTTVWITSAFVTHRIISAARIIIHVLGSTTEKNLITASQGNSNSVSFPMPIKVEAGDTIFLTLSGIGESGIGGITGWIEPKKIS